MGGSVKTMGAYTAFGESDCIDHVFDGAEFECCQSEFLADLFDHSVIAFRAVGRVLVKMSLVISFQSFDHSAGYELHLCLGGSEVKECAWIDERGT